MNKKALLAGAIAISSLIALSSCNGRDYEITWAYTFEDAYSLFKNFFAKTFEHTNMEVSIQRTKDFYVDPETKKWGKEESEEIEEILGDSSHRYNKDGSKEDWAFVTDEGQKIVATQKTIVLDDGTTSKEQTYRSDGASYQSSYKSYLKQLNFFEAIANEAASTGKTPEEVGGFDSVEWTAHQKCTNYSDGKREHWEEYDCMLVKHDEGDDDLGDIIYNISAVFFGDEGLVQSCSFSHDNYENGAYCGIERFTLEFKYNNVDDIDLPDISGWESENE